MSYIIHKPKGVLSEYIKCIWILEEGVSCGGNSCTTLIPSGSIEIIFHFGGKGKYYIGQKNDFILTDTSITGQKSKYANYNSNGTKGILAVMLQPDKANFLLGLPSNKLKNTTIDLDKVFESSADELYEKLNVFNTSKERIKIIENYFYNKAIRIEKYIDPRIREFERQVSLNGGCLNINSLADYLNISKRQLERKVLESIGLTPKEFCRIIRFHKALYLKQINKAQNLNDIAYECGFSDQAHFINEFKSISGYSPKKYFKLTTPFSDYYTYN